MSFASFIRAAKLGVSNLFLPSLYRALRDEGRLRVNEEVLISLLCMMTANILDGELLTIISSRDANHVAALLAFTRAHEMDCSDSEAVSWFLFDSASAMIIAVLE